MENRVSMTRKAPQVPQVLEDQELDPGQTADL
jgi:hypothetical protein